VHAAAQTLEYSSVEAGRQLQKTAASKQITRCRFLGDPAARNAKLKLIPALAQGSWIVRQAVGQTPVMLGKRLKAEYFTEKSYVEADVDISANSTAASVTSMVAGAIKSLVFDIGIVLEVRIASLLHTL
jgi:hypothetical protein